MADMASPEQLRARLSRIEGQIRGISRMLESDRACEEVGNQLMAVRSGIDAVGALGLDLHLGNCMGSEASPARVGALRDSVRMWWRFAPGAVGFAATASDEDALVEPTPGGVAES